MRSEARATVKLHQPTKNALEAIREEMIRGFGMHVTNSFAIQRLIDHWRSTCGTVNATSTLTVERSSARSTTE